MKKIVLVFSLILFSVSSFAQIHGVLSFDGGNVIIERGTPVPTVIKHMGEPLWRDSQTYCASRITQDAPCNRWGTREVWYYEHRGRNWELTIISGRVTNLKWEGY